MKAKTIPAAAPVKWEEQPLEWPRAVGHADTLLAALKVRERRQRRRRVTAAASAVLLAAGGFWLHAQFSPVAAPLPSVASRGFQLTVPERRILPDGSTVELRPGSDVVVNFDPGSSGARQVELSKGEAHFHVATNAARPFIVTAGGVRFRAVGTAFSVELNRGAAELIVTEGRVAIEHPSVVSAVGEPLATVPAGNRVVVDSARPGSAPEITPLSKMELDRELSWRVPRLEFNETLLWEVVSLLNQHSGSHISLASSELGRVEISGALRANNVEPLLQMLETNYGIRVVRAPDGQIELRRNQ